MCARLHKSAALPRDVQESVPVFAALGDDTRLGLIARLCTEGPASIAELTRGTGVTRQAVTKHLAVLSGAGLVRDARQGRARVWEIEPHRLLMARRFLDRMSERWAERLACLRAFVERG
jgi:DNA-binding transcriptional ArsR family regulator